MDDSSDFLDFLEKLMDPEARAAGSEAVLKHYGDFDRPARATGDSVDDPAYAVLERAWSHPKTRRMTLLVMRTTFGWDRNELARLLGVSPAAYNRIELGTRAVSREELEELAGSQGVPRVKLEELLLINHALVVDLDTSWQRTWQDKLAPLTVAERRALVLAETSLQNQGLAELICARSLDSGNPDEAVTLAELALLVADHLPDGSESFRRTCQSYAWGHFGHALQRRGDQTAAEIAFDECIEIWKSAGEAGQEVQTYAERLALIVPSFPSYEPPPRRRRQPARSPRKKTSPSSKSSR
jgi:transcriptional regulator with XRE-family HTH domain